MRTLWVWDRAHFLRSLWSEVHSHLVRALPGQISCPLQRHRFSRATRQVQGCSSLYNSQLILQALALVVRSVLVRRASDSHHHLQLVVQRGAHNNGGHLHVHTTMYNKPCTTPAADASIYIPYIKQMSCVALPLFGLPPVCPRVHSLGYVGDA